MGTVLNVSDVSFESRPVDAAEEVNHKTVAKLRPLGKGKDNKILEATVWWTAIPVVIFATLLVRIVNKIDS